MVVSLRSAFMGAEERTSQKGNHYIQMSFMDGATLINGFHNLEASKMVEDGTVKLPELYTPYMIDLDVRLGKYTKVEVIGWRKLQ